ncbi:hypothetical protein GGX14DRAFT_396812 [Mycena pura]|uniref:Uncharacterized protein n=1 Tax=Mycena pura TaxID=153505 RepID=A0AAD6VA02_9AGAR|nr:hypothetical protein GGX14DRAFT_396812 [Mycena pura]
MLDELPIEDVRSEFPQGFLVTMPDGKFQAVPSVSKTNSLSANSGVFSTAVCVILEHCLVSPPSMDEEPPFQPGLTTSSAFGEEGPSPAQYAGAFFTHAHGFVVTGGIFQSVTTINHAAPRDPADYRVIPLGDLNLLREIGLRDASGIVSRRRGQAAVRRMYSARIHGSSSTVTAIMYQGDGAEEQWHKDISQYANFRHPYIFQLYGVVDMKVLHAAVVHEGLIPYRELWKEYHNSHFSMVYFLACMDAEKYILSASGMELDWSMYTVWIRPSTGQICIDLAPPEHQAAALEFLKSDAGPSGTLLDPPEPTEIIYSIPNREYHSICALHLSWFVRFSISTDASVQIGSIRHLSGTEYEPSLEIAIVPKHLLDEEGWSTEDPDIEARWLPIEDCAEKTLILENGWIRFKDYVFIEGIEYQLRLCGSIDDLPPGYLFLCPLLDLRTEVPMCFRIPECAAYWALDPRGVERLTAAEANARGFPHIEFSVEVLGRRWDSSVYAGIRQFQEAKDFDPYSEDFALEVCRVTCGRDGLLAHWNDTGDRYLSKGKGFSDSGNEDYVSSHASIEDASDVEHDSESDSDLDDVAEEESPSIVGHTEFIVQEESREHDNHNDRTLGENRDEISAYIPIIRHYYLDEAESLAPSRIWNITMCLQFALILTLTKYSRAISTLPDPVVVATIRTKGVEPRIAGTRQCQVTNTANRSKQVEKGGAKTTA